MKRVPKDGGFWQAITGTVEPGEEILDTVKRELVEEAGISEPVYISAKLVEYEWFNSKRGYGGRDTIFAVEVSPIAEVVISIDEHSEYKWLQIEDALALLKFDGNKKSMQLVLEHANSR